MLNEAVNYCRANFAEAVQQMRAQLRNDWSEHTSVPQRARLAAAFPRTIAENRVVKIQVQEGQTVTEATKGLIFDSRTRIAEWNTFARAEREPRLIRYFLEYDKMVPELTQDPNRPFLKTVIDAVKASRLKVNGLARENGLPEIYSLLP